MRLGVVLMGVGVDGAVGAGVLGELMRRRMEPYAVCGLGTGAWPAALYAVGAEEEALMRAAAHAARMGKRMLRRGASGRALLRGRDSLFAAPGLERLLGVQTQGRVLALCPRRAVFLARHADGRRIVFTTRHLPCAQGELMAMQTGVGFAARACMAFAPFLPPLEWAGAPLLPAMDVCAAAQHLTELGAQRVLIVQGRRSPRTRPDALERTALCCMAADESALPPGAAMLHVPLPDGVSALSLGAVNACVEAGKKTAGQQLDCLFERMGMSFCRVIPFRR